MSEVFGTMPDGTPVHRVQLNGGGLSASVLTYGAVLQDLRLKGHDHPLVLGFAEFAPYLTDSPYFGATAGRYANRIRDGHLELDGVTHQLDCNFLSKHLLHGGAGGMGKMVWDLEDTQPDRVTLALTLPDGHMGFPGELKARVTFALLEGGVFDVVMQATTDKATLCNLAHHSYWCLDDSGGISDHLLQIDAPTYLPVNDELIPTGEVADVAGTRFDFRTATPVKKGGGMDHNFCLSQSPQALRSVAELTSPKSGIALEIATTEPGLQIYDASRMDVAVPGLVGQKMGPFAGVAIEPQLWPDSNHNESFAQAVLRPGETYRQHTQFKISRGSI